MCSKKGTLKYKEVINIMHEMNNNKISKEELLIMAKHVVSYVTLSYQYRSSYEKGWNKKSVAELSKIVNDFKTK